MNLATTEKGTDIAHISEQYQEIQKNACRIIEENDGKGKFSEQKWNKDIGFGITRVMQNGSFIEKAAINFSHVSGKYKPQMARMAGKSGETFAATGVSSIMHPFNPHAPVIHMNIRYFELNNGQRWFGGGIDLTPHYVDKKEAAYFHSQLKKLCDSFDIQYYTKFKPWADDYFFLQHRNETRGIGGIFFDLLEPADDQEMEKLFHFTSELGKLYPLLYSELFTKKSTLPFTKEEKEWQLLRRGRYAEFNLIYDRGTKFGLESNGNTESILVSLPPQANWTYNYQAKPNSREIETLQLLKKDIDWIKLA